jgi:hypothetical protein
MVQDNHARPERDFIQYFAAIRPQGCKFLKWLEMHLDRRLLWDAKEQSQFDTAVIDNITSFCIGYRRSCIIDDDFVVDGAGTKLAMIAAEEVLTQASTPLNEFKAWNLEIDPPWHNEHPSCSCGSREITNPAGSRNVRLCGVYRRVSGQ